MADGSRDVQTMHSFQPGPDTARAFRNTLGCFATGVTIVTCQDSQGPLAMTANSFASVSLDPPLVLWSAAKSSSRYASFVKAQDFAIHVLSEEQGDLASHFAKDGRAFSDVVWEADANGAPLFPICLARFTCRLHAAHDAGDHTILIGEVTEAAHAAGAPLLFARGSYGRFTNGL